MFLELNPICFSNYKKAFPAKQFNNLKEFFSDFFDFAKLHLELIVIYNDNAFFNQSVWEISQYFKKKNSCFTQSFKQKHFIINHIIISVPTERSFSVLRRIKTY